MRLSCVKGDPGYDPEAIIKEYQFLCDGKEVFCCITVDEEEGFILCYALDEEGKPIQTADGTEFERVTLRGKVEIIGG
jgi:hypothetical protein